MIDPLPILAALDSESDDAEDDSLASVVDQSNARSEEEQDAAEDSD